MPRGYFTSSLAREPKGVCIGVCLTVPGRAIVRSRSHSWEAEMLLNWRSILP